MGSCGRAAFAALSLGVLAAFAAAPAATSAQTVEPSQSDASLPPAPADADLADDPASLDPQLSDAADRLVAWITVSNDNHGAPFMIVDKLAADVFVFDADGVLVGEAPVLVGIARGDDSAPGVGDMALSAIPMDERTTPAGRFVARFGPSLGEGRVLWVDYANAISMHPVITSNPREHRLQRIRSAAPREHRISHGCINVPAKFYRNVLLKDFGGGGIVYVLPDTKSLTDVFPALADAPDADADTDAGTKAEAQEARCADPLLDAQAGVPDPDPSRMCPVDDQQTTDAAAAP